MRARGSNILATRPKRRRLRCVGPSARRCPVP
jgi:hypothetical protein